MVHLNTTATASAQPVTGIGSEGQLQNPILGFGEARLGSGIGTTDYNITLWSGASNVPVPALSSSTEHPYITPTSEVTTVANTSLSTLQLVAVVPIVSAAVAIAAVAFMIKSGEVDGKVIIGLVSTVVISDVLIICAILVVAKIQSLAPAANLIEIILRGV